MLSEFTKPNLMLKNSFMKQKPVLGWKWNYIYERVVRSDEIHGTESYRGRAAGPGHGG